jgi:hypothetical protein
MPEFVSKYSSSIEATGKILRANPYEPLIRRVIREEGSRNEIEDFFGENYLEQRLSNVFCADSSDRKPALETGAFPVASGFLEVLDNLIIVLLRTEC